MKKLGIIPGISRYLAGMAFSTSIHGPGNAGEALLVAVESANMVKVIVITWGEGMHYVNST